MKSVLARCTKVKKKIIVNDCNQKRGTHTLTYTIQEKYSLFNVIILPRKASKKEMK